MDYFQISKHGVYKLAFLLAGVLLAILILVAAAGAVRSRPDYYTNCSDAKAHHDANIPKSSIYYRPELDRDHNGIACQT